MHVCMFVCMDGWMYTYYSIGIFFLFGSISLTPGIVFFGSVLFGLVWFCFILFFRSFVGLFPFTATFPVRRLLCMEYTHLFPFLCSFSLECSSIRTNQVIFILVWCWLLLFAIQLSCVLWH